MRDLRAGVQLRLRLGALCTLFEANPIEGGVQHSGELAATIGDQLFESLLFALKGVDSLAALRGEVIGLGARVVDHASPLGVEVCTRLVKLVPTTGVLQLVRCSALLELLLGVCCRTPGLLQLTLARLLGFGRDLARGRACVRDELFAGVLRREQDVADRGGILEADDWLLVQLVERPLELVGLIHECLDGLGDVGQEGPGRGLVESAQAFPAVLLRELRPAS